MKSKRSKLILPRTAAVSRRDALKMGAAGIGGLAIGGSALAACGNDDGGSPAPTTAAPATAAPTTAAPGVDKVKAHWVYIGPPDDNGWTEAHDIGRLVAQNALGDQVETAYTPNIGFDASTTQLFQSLVDDGNHIIFANTEYAGLMSEVADGSPDTFFVETNGHTWTDNILPFYLAHEIPAYLLGIAAGMMADNGRIGYIGAFPTATAYNDVNGLLLGARSVNPDAVVETVLVSTFFDPQLAAGAANALLDSGVDFLFGVMDEPTFMQISEDNGVWTGYWNGDFASARNAAPTKFVASFELTEFGPFYTEQCRRVLNGTWSSIPEGDVILLDNPLSDWGPNVPQDVKDAVAAARAAIDSGDLSVYTGPLNDNQGNQVLAAGETIDSKGAYAVDWAVEGVTGLD